MTQWGVDTLFNPAKRHMDEEKRRLQATRAEVGDNSGGRRIDLASGKVRISRGPKAADPEQPADDATAEDPTAEADSTDADSGSDEIAVPADARADAASAEDVETEATTDTTTDAETDPDTES